MGDDSALLRDRESRTGAVGRRRRGGTGSSSS